MIEFMQKIYFGSPGTGKSYTVTRGILPKLLGTDYNSETYHNNYISTVFHPEYTYGDFMGKLLPLTKDKQVTYRYYEGHFLRALAQAYRNILKDNDPRSWQNVALVIDEINRGNSAAIFGTIFQLLATPGVNSHPCHQEET